MGTRRPDADAKQIENGNHRVPIGAGLDDA
jgi:hypothetical protein